jgi:hypothetical protein
MTISMTTLTGLRLGLAAGVLLALGTASPAHAALLYNNGSFENVGTNTSSFAISYNGAILPDWAATATGNQVLDCLVFAGATTNVCGTSADGGGQSFYVYPGSSPDGGNYVAIDADTTYSSPLTQTVTGFVVGQKYNVTFYQAAAQQTGFTGAYNVQWQVSLGGTTLNSTVMALPSHGDVGWGSQLLTFTATAASMVLSFAPTDNAPSGGPPFALLDGINITETPEPGAFLLMGTGLIAVPLALRIRRSRRKL